MARQSTTPVRSLRLGAFVAIMAMALLPSAALAATDSDAASVPATDTDFAHTLSVDSFDPALGTLQSVTVTLDGNVTGVMEVENTSTSSGGTGSVQLSAAITLRFADDAATHVAAAALPVDARTFDLSVFDGAADFAGTSGASIGGTAADSATSTYHDPALLAAFTGTGTTELVVEAVGTSSASGDTGNIESNFVTQASAAVTVSYEYVPAGLPAINIEKTPDLQTVLVGGDAPFTITVTNPGPVDLVNVTVTDPLAPDCDRFIGDLAVGETTTYECTAFAVTEPFTNVAFVTGEDESGNPVDDEDDAVVEVGDVRGLGAIVIEKTPDQQTVVEGDDVTFSITVTNTGPVDLVNVVVTDPLATDCDRVIGDLPVGASVAYQCVAPAVTQPFTNIATVVGEDDDGNVVEDEDDADVDVVSDDGDLPRIDIEKTPDIQTLVVGDDASFTITVTNTGPVDLVNVVVTDPRSPDCDNVIGALAAGATTTYECTAFDVTEPFTNVATVTGDDGNGNGVSDSDDARVEVGDVLPLTGIDSSLIALAGLMLLTTGFVLVLVARGQTRPLHLLLVAFILLLPMLVGAGAAAVAAEMTEDHIDAIPSTPTNWDDQVSFPQFDPQRGDLTAVTITLTGSMDATMAVENTSTSSPCSATLDWDGEYALLAGGDLYEFRPSDSQAMTLDTFDGAVDFGGASGASFSSTLAVDSGEILIAEPVALAAFIGTGAITFDISARAATFVTGCGNISQVLTTSAGAEATVSYRYEHGDGAAIDIEKHTNGEDADLPTGPGIPIGEPVLWEYFVTNTGDAALSGVMVADDQGVSVLCPQDALAVGETMTCTGSGIAEEGQYANVGTATGVAEDGTIVEDEDPSHYYGSTVRTWVDCAHGALGCLGIGGEAPGPVVVFIDGEQVECETESQPGTTLVRFNCMFDSRFLPETVTVEVYSAGQLLWVGTDIPTICFEVSDPPTDDPASDPGDETDDDTNAGPADRSVVNDRTDADEGDSGTDDNDRDQPGDRDTDADAGEPDDTDVDDDGGPRSDDGDDRTSHGSDDGADAGDSDVTDDGDDGRGDTTEPTDDREEETAVSGRQDGSSTGDASASSRDDPVVTCPAGEGDEDRAARKGRESDDCDEPGDEVRHGRSDVGVREDD